MSLRARIVVVVVTLSGLATVLVGAWAVQATSGRLDDEVDRSLDETVTLAAERVPAGLGGDPGRGQGRGRLGRLPPRSPAQASLPVQIIDGSGVVVVVSDLGALPVDDAARAVAASDAAGVVLDQSTAIDGDPVRLRTESLGEGRGAVQAARSTAEADRVVSGLRARVLAAVALVMVAAGLAGWWLAGLVTAPLRRLTAAAEEVGATGRLDVDVPARPTDEVGRLGSAFASMLAALRRSRESQARLVQDAGHELRTPLTSVRANAAVLARHPDLDAETRARVVADLEAETAELTDLVDELVTLATVGVEDEPRAPVALGEVAEAVAVRARRRTGRDVRVTADASAVSGRRGALERALANLVDNAAKFDPAGAAPIEVEVRDGAVSVADRGPGIDPADLPHVFDRFYRAVGARSVAGSGLGLAIVADVAADHGGQPFARSREGGGAVVGFTVSSGPSNSSAHENWPEQPPMAPPAAPSPVQT